MIKFPAQGEDEFRLRRSVALPEQGINAKAETVAEKPAYRAAFKKRRCLVVADGFYEWKAAGAVKAPHWFTLREGRPFAFAGLWERWRKPDGADLDSFTIITTEPNELTRAVHNRMPVILAPEHYARWLDPECNDVAALRGDAGSVSGGGDEVYAGQFLHEQRAE